MSFLLLSRAEDGGLRLLSDTAFPSLKEARRELSRVTGDSGFEGWDDEVFVIDLGSATPILLVRPASAEAADEVAEDAVGEDDVDESAEVEDEIAAVREELESDEEEPTLKDALRRTTVQLEAEGITAPESVGPAEDEPPQDDSSEEEPSESASETESASAGSDDAAAWPWDTAAADDRPFDLDALEEPRDENESLVRAPGDEETMAVAHPVILGADFASASTEDESAAADAAAEEVFEAAPVEASPVEETFDEPQQDEPVGAGDADITDHAPEAVIEPEPESPVSGEPDATTSEQDESESIVVETADATNTESDFIDLGDIASMTCDDCVYAETCPNRGQMLPTSCGSFQWK